MFSKNCKEKTTRYLFTRKLLLNKWTKMPNLQQKPKLEEKKFKMKWVTPIKVVMRNSMTMKKNRNRRSNPNI